MRDKDRIIIQKIINYINDVEIYISDMQATRYIIK